MQCEEVRVIGDLGHSWDCQKSDNPKIQKLIDNGFFVIGREGDELITEVTGRTELNFYDGITQIIHKPSRTIVKFRL